MPQDVISTSNSSSHLLVRWKPPTQRNGNITYYLVLWQRLAEDGDLYLNDYCHRGAQGSGAGRRGWDAGRGAVRLTAFPCVAPGLRLPTSNSDPRFDREDAELQAETEPGCCPCQHPPPGQVLPPLEAQEASFQKKFENFLHNAITIPKCGETRHPPHTPRGPEGPGRGGAGVAGGVGAGPRRGRVWLEGEGPGWGRSAGGADPGPTPPSLVSPDPPGR